jgi:hypothetical protein
MIIVTIIIFRPFIIMKRRLIFQYAIFSYYHVSFAYIKAKLTSEISLSDT